MEKIILAPKEIKSSATPEIRTINNWIRISGAYDKGITPLVKEKKFFWKIDSWAREINEMSGDIKDRAAEIAGILLENGVSVALYDEEIKEKCINGTWEIEWERWISHDVSELHIWCEDYKILEKAGYILGSKKRRNKPYMTIPISSYEEVLEFAETYDFRFTTGALREIEKYKNSVIVVDNVRTKKRNYKDDSEKIKHIMDSSFEVLEDLKDAN